VVHVPSKGDEQFVDEVLANGGFIILLRKEVRFAGVELFDECGDGGECGIEGHGVEGAKVEGQKDNSSAHPIKGWAPMRDHPIDCQI